MRIAVVPARGGSKRITRKNIKPFCGKPILQWAIETAIRSGLFDRVIVSTDEHEIAETALAAGAEVPFFRPAKLADDFTATIPVICHAIDELCLDKSTEVCCIYPTAVFTTVTLLKDAVDLLDASQADFVMPVTVFSCPLGRALALDNKYRLTLLTPQNENLRTQDCQTFYHDVGQFYLGKVSAWLDDKPFYAKDVRGLVLPRYLSHDIDTPEDWFFAELIFNAIRNQN